MNRSLLGPSHDRPLLVSMLSSARSKATDLRLPSSSLTSCSSKSSLSCLFLGISSLPSRQCGSSSWCRSSAMLSSSMTFLADTECLPKAYPSSPRTSNRDPSLSSASSNRISSVRRSPSVVMRRFLSSLTKVPISIWSGRVPYSPDMRTSPLRSIASMSCMRLASSLLGSFLSVSHATPRCFSRAIWSFVHIELTILAIALWSAFSMSKLLQSSSSLRHCSSTLNASVSWLSASRSASCASGRLLRAGDMTSKLWIFGVPNEMRFFSAPFFPVLRGPANAPPAFGFGEVKKLMMVSMRDAFLASGGEGSCVCGEAERFLFLPALSSLMSIFSAPRQP
mmetsp:Transcript_33250/g.83931  ORF Transcript_33250/g.83931 Transcript_33250/m.83931 type:complete len:337 (-) Transcript_33250:96-1106(-)